MSDSKTIYRIHAGTVRQLILSPKNIDSEQKLIVGARATLELFIPIDKSVNGTHTYSVILAGTGAQCKVHAAGIVGVNKNLTLKIDTTHRGVHTNGSTLVKTIISRKAALDFSGMIKIDPGAQKSVDFLRQDSLLLHESARSNALPALEIEADDVQASHAATAAPLNQDQLFYIASRGIKRRQAEALVCRAFVGPALFQWLPDEIKQFTHKKEPAAQARRLVALPRAQA